MVDIQNIDILYFLCYFFYCKTSKYNTVQTSILFLRIFHYFKYTIILDIISRNAMKR